MSLFHCFGGAYSNLEWKSEIWGVTDNYYLEAMYIFQCSSNVNACRDFVSVRDSTRSQGEGDQLSSYQERINAKLTSKWYAMLFILTHV